MSWHDQLFNYCERGADSSLWAEPLNAISNIGFLFAGIKAARRLARMPRDQLKTGSREHVALVGLVMLLPLIGAGSFAFHTVATRWALIADVGPTTAFMLTYLVLALRLFLGLGWVGIALAVAIFLGSGFVLDHVACVSKRGVAEPCLNGSLGYLPALVSLWLVGALAWRRTPAASRSLFAAGALFSVSLLLRTIDFQICSSSIIAGHATGAHAAWHVLNAVTLYLLLAAAIDHAGCPLEASRPQ